MYVIKCETYNSGYGISDFCLNTDLKWCLATVSPKYFKSVKEAKIFFFSPEAKNIQPVGTSIWIEGPKGGRYAMSRIGF